MNFKAQVERDLTAVFHNAREHADVMEFWIDGVRYKGPVIIDDGGDLVHLMHTEFTDLIPQVIGGCEETTTGIHRLRIMDRAGSCASR